ncbi:MAG: class I SAM-dependent methyltransferase [Tannerella sp.]|jgi:SAM-dependent methyltransferase|nr:class I SAM-dependent methyltransferase [Tannerella sp.]
MEKYFNEKFLFGDDFSESQIFQWFNEEAEAYANLYGKHANTNNHSYGYHNLNMLYGYRYLNRLKFNNVLGFGSSWGYEFLPIIDRVKKLTIIESSSQTVSKKIGKIVPVYKKPNVNGKIDYPDNTFDLVTCFDTLHHIPNVSFVLNELFRILCPNNKPNRGGGGYLLLREPTISMGDWRTTRPGLTTNERGIPKDYLSKIIKDANMEIVQKHYYSCATSFLKRNWKKLNSDSWMYLYFDKHISRLLSFNTHYHAVSKLQRIAPSSVFYVLRKPVSD